MPLEANALTTYDAVKSYIRAADDANKADLERIINSVSTWIENQTARKFGKTSYTERSDGRSTYALPLNQYPVLTLTSVSIDGTTVDLTEIDIESESGILNRDKGWSAKDRGIRIVYDAGYVTPEQVRAAAAETPTRTLVRTLPFDLEDACIQIVAIRNDMRGSEHLKSERIDVLSSDFLDTLPHAARDTICNYRKWR